MQHHLATRLPWPATGLLHSVVICLASSVFTAVAAGSAAVLEALLRGTATRRTGWHTRAVAIVRQVARLHRCDFVRHHCHTVWPIRARRWMWAPCRGHLAPVRCTFGHAGVSRVRRRRRPRCGWGCWRPTRRQRGVAWSGRNRVGGHGAHLNNCRLHLYVKLFNIVSQLLVHAQQHGCVSPRVCMSQQSLTAAQGMFLP